MTDNSTCSTSGPEGSSEDDSTLLKYCNGDNIDEVKDYIKKVLDSRDQSIKTQELIDLAKSSKEAISLVKELINLNQVDETELADRISREIIRDIELYVDLHIEQYQKYTLNAPQLTTNVDGSKAKFFNLISLLRDVSILGRKLLEMSPRFESSKPRTLQVANLNSLDKKRLVSSSSSSSGGGGGGGGQRDANSQMSEGDATSEDLLAALIESSSTDDFLVLSSSLESITVRDMMTATLILITSHECFTLSHDIQGVVMVLRRTKFMINNILAPKNQMELVTRLLTSISRYNEMNYVFDLFRDRNQFEILLSKGVEKTPELRIALFNYVRKNPEFYSLVTLNFSMFREIAESLEASAMRRLDKLIQSKKNKKKKVSLILSPTDGSAGFKKPQQRPHQDGISVGGGFREPAIASSTKKSNSIATSLSNFDCNAKLTSDGGGGGGGCNNKPLYFKDSLNLCLVEMVDASDCFAKAGCYKRANSCESKAKLIALQLALLPCETNVLDLQQSELNDSVVSFESFSDAYIVAEAYNYHLAWRQALFRKVVLRGQSNYLEEYCKKCDLSPALVMELVILYKQYMANNHLSHDETTRLANSMKSILSKLCDVELRCKLYSQLNFTDAKDQLLANPSIRAHLKDLKLA